MQVAWARPCLEIRFDRRLEECHQKRSMRRRISMIVRKFSCMEMQEFKYSGENAEAFLIPP